MVISSTRLIKANLGQKVSILRRRLCRPSTHIGSADLTPSTKTRLTAEGMGDFAAGNPAGRNLHFGVREHAMASLLNGLSLCKVRPFGSGFLIFSDYARPVIRLSALMELPVIHIFTHDSIGVALISYLELCNVEANLAGYNRAALGLDSVASWWSGLPEGMKADPANFAALVDRTETILGYENAAWVQEMRTAQAEEKETEIGEE